MKSLLTSLPVLLPIVYDWAETQAALAMQNGEPLGDVQLTDARRAGVSHPERIRLARVEKLPQPDNDDLMFIARQIGLFNERTVGISLGYAVFLHSDASDERRALVHECVHVGQHEKLNGLRPFLDKYLRECLDPGYPFGRLEQEAILISRDICRHANN